MRPILAMIGILALLPFGGSAGEKQPKQEYAEFSRLAHAIAVKQLPKQFEDTSGWGQRVEIPGNLALMALRTTVKVGDRLEAPHGAWRRFNGKIEDPDKNLKITVKDFKKLDDKTYRIVVDIDAIITCQAEWQQWQKGLLLIKADAIADVNVAAAVVCDVGVALNFKKIPPALDLDPKVAELGLDLVDFKIRNGPLLKGEKGKLLANEFKDVMRTVVKASEPFVREQVNQAIVQSLKEGKGTISAGEIMKALPMPK